MGGEECPEGLLLEPQQLALVELLDRDRRTVVREPAAERSPGSAAGPPPRSKIEPWPRRASSCDLEALAWAADSTSSIPLRTSPGGVERPALDQALDGALVDGPRVDPLAEVPDRGERPAALARAR